MAPTRRRAASTLLLLVLSSVEITRARRGPGWQPRRLVARRCAPSRAAARGCAPPDTRETRALEVPDVSRAPGALSRRAAFALLNAVACVWGTQHPVIKQCVETGYAQTHSALAAAGMLNLGRFAVGALVFAPFLPPLARGSALAPADASAAASWRYGAELGLWTFAGFALQAIGLESTSASRSAFLLYLNVKLVPLLSSALYRTPIAPSTWLSAFAALCGTALLSSDGLAPNAGDAWSVLAALASAAFIVRLQAASVACAGRGRSLNAVTLLVACSLCALWCAALAAARAPAEPASAAAALGADLVAFGESEWRALLYLGVVCTGLCSWAQTIGQREVGAEQAAIVYATDPLWAALFSWLALGESLGARGWAGAALILAAAVSTQALALAAPPAPIAKVDPRPDGAQGSRGADLPAAACMNATATGTV